LVLDANADVEVLKALIDKLQAALVNKEGEAARKMQDALEVEWKRYHELDLRGSAI